MNKKKDRSSYTIEDFYISYKDYTLNNDIYKVPKTIFRSIITDYMCYLMDEIIYRAKEIRLPSGLGRVFVNKKKPLSLTMHGLNIDFKTSKDINKVVFHLNEHSDGYMYRFKWEKKDIIMHNKSYYELVHNRASKRKLASVIKSKEVDYIEKK